MLFGFLFLGNVVFATGTFLDVACLRLVTPIDYISGLPFVVWMEVTNQTHEVNRTVWDAEVLLTVSPTAAGLSTNRVKLTNGRGCAFVSVQGTGPVELRAVGLGFAAQKQLRDVTGQAPRTYAGTLTGAETTWSNLVQVTGDLVVPTNHTLTILAGTRVLIAGAASGTGGADLLVRGNVQARGTEAEPITFTCGSTNLALNWGEIRHTNSTLTGAVTNRYQYTFINRGGRAPAVGHTGTGPLLRLFNAPGVFSDCALTEATAPGTTPTIGKIMQASGSDLVFQDCFLTRARMGPEIDGSALLCTNTWFVELHGPDDADGIYLHGQRAGQTITLSKCVFSDMNDDAIDTLGSIISVNDCIIRDCLNMAEDAKGISIFGGEVRVDHSLIVNCFNGVSGKGGNGERVLLRMNRSTVTSTVSYALGATNKSGTTPIIDFLITNSIIAGPDTLFTSYAPADIKLYHCLVGESWAGASDCTLGTPAFVDASTGDYRLQAASAAIDAGDPQQPRDLDGTLPDIGYFAFDQRPSVAVSTNAATVEWGTNLTLSATVSGGVPMGYQWLFAGQAIDGATNAEYLMTSVLPAQSGLYCLVVSNRTGVATSEVVVVTIASTDRDQDGLPDDWEWRNGLSFTNQGDARLDADLDGASNWQEYLAGTSPTNALDVFQLQSPANLAAPDFTFVAQPNRSYTIEVFEPQQGGGWSRWLDIAPAGNLRTIRLNQAVDPAVSLRLFRVRTPQLP
jgi:hypothetical protein